MSPAYYGLILFDTHSRYCSDSTKETRTQAHLHVAHQMTLENSYSHPRQPVVFCPTEIHESIVIVYRLASCPLM